MAIKHTEKKISRFLRVAMTGLPLLHVDSWEGDKRSKGEKKRKES